MYLTNLRKRKLFLSVKFRICVTFLVIFTFWQLIRGMIYYHNEKIIYKRIQSYNLSLVEGNKEMPRISVAVYYEALCPDSKNFILQQIVPSFKKAPSSFDIEFVPYGKAQTDENSDESIKFTCQHGPIECYANQIHSCAIKYVYDQSKLINYLSCMIANNDEPKDIGIECANKYNVDWNAIYDCSEGKEGKQLLKLNGDKTNTLRPQVSFIPTITINNEQPRQASVLKNFWAVACNYFPPESKPVEC